MPTRYACELYNSVDDIDADEWREVCRSSENMYLDPRFLKAVELSFVAEAQFWYAVYRDEAGRAVAATCFSRYRVDGALLAPPVVQKIVSIVRRIWPGFFQFRLMMCGVPVTTCDCQLAIVDDADLEGILAGLDETAVSLARQSGCRLLSFMQFSPELAAKLDGLSRYGFHKTRSAYAYHLEGNLDSFDAYLASRNSKARWNIRKSLKQFEATGLTCEQFRGRDGAEQLFTPEVHQLYLNVLNRAKVRFERIPNEFFQEFARQYPDESCYTVIRQGERIVAFCCGLADGDQYALLWVGFDYSINAETELYFNVMYRCLEQGLAPGVRVVYFGASADQFKQRVGCRGTWLSIYVKAIYPPGQLLLKWLSGLLFDTRDSLDAPPPVGTARETGVVAGRQRTVDQSRDSTGTGVQPVGNHS